MHGEIKRCIHVDGDRCTAQVCCLANVLVLSNEVPHDAWKEAKVTVASGKTVCSTNELKCLHCSMYLQQYRVPALVSSGWATVGGQS